MVRSPRWEMSLRLTVVPVKKGASVRHSIVKSSTKSTSDTRTWSHSLWASGKTGRPQRVCPMTPKQRFLSKFRLTKQPWNRSREHARDARDVAKRRLLPAGALQRRLRKSNVEHQDQDARPARKNGSVLPVRFFPCPVCS